MKMPNFSINNRVVIFTGFGAVILTSILSILLILWNKPDLRYEVGSYYQTGDSSIASLRLHNYGNTDAEDVLISISFPKPINDIASSDPAVILTTQSGGITFQYSVLSIRRVVPGQTIVIYISMERIDAIIGESSPSFISSITYKGGIGKSGLPFYLNPLYAALIELILVLSVLVAVVFLYLELSKLKKELVLLETATNVIDKEIIKAKKRGIRIPRDVEKLQNAVKTRLYGSSKKLSKKE
jgi:hypothetical protein